MSSLAEKAEQRWTITEKGRAALAAAPAGPNSCPTCHGPLSGDEALPGLRWCDRCADEYGDQDDYCGEDDLTERAIENRNDEWASRDDPRGF